MIYIHPVEISDIRKIMFTYVWLPQAFWNDLYFPYYETSPFIFIVCAGLHENTKMTDKNEIILVTKFYSVLYKTPEINTRSNDSISEKAGNDEFGNRIE